MRITITMAHTNTLIAGPDLQINEEMAPDFWHKFTRTLPIWTRLCNWTRCLGDAVHIEYDTTSCVDAASLSSMVNLVRLERYFGVRHRPASDDNGRHKCVLTNEIADLSHMNIHNSSIAYW